MRTSLPYAILLALLAGVLVLAAYVLGWTS
jgi:hypothetical protein